MNGTPMPRAALRGEAAKWGVKFALVYVLAFAVGWFTTHGIKAFFWPAYPVAVSALLLCPMAALPVLSSVMVATSIAFHAASGHFLAGLVIGVSDVVEALPWALLARRLMAGAAGRLWLGRTLILILTIGMAGPLTGGILMTLNDFMRERLRPHPLSETVFVAAVDMGTTLILVPALLAISTTTRRAWTRHMARLPSAEIAAMALCVTAAAGVQFAAPVNPVLHQALPAATMLLLVWIAMRGGVLHTALANLVIGLGGVTALELRLSDVTQALDDLPLDAMAFHITLSIQFATAMLIAATTRDLMEQRRLAEVATRAKSVFLANMSHELRTPLNAVIGFSELIRDQVYGSAGDKRYVEYGNDIALAGRHLLGVINDILEISRIESGRLVLEATDFDLSEAVAGAVKHFSTAAAVKRIALKYDLDATFSRMRADRRAVHQMIASLVSNAVKFTDSGEIVVSSAVTAAGFVISVRDTGIGMGAEELARMTAPFERSAVANSRAIPGAGLGLAIVKLLIEAHGGRLELQRNMSGGTTAALIFPVELAKL